ncbi:MAG TPA: DUF1844 domain-containing protein [Candidatus Binataceae bacterium]|nr:DUF1844 domain-containing protein [Candidatus Binataceae bacterium]
MEEAGEKKGFKVEDRRRFSAEGELKPEHRAEEPKPAAVEKPHGPEASSAASKPPERPAGPEPEINFATFIVGLSTEALAALGEMPDPATGNRSRDLRAAQQLIDIIGMLRNKTRGNLDRNEEGLIDAILFDLRMKYVELAKAPVG